MMFRLIPLLALLSGSSAFTHTPSFLPSQTTRRTTSSLKMVSINTSDIKNGLTVELLGEPHKVISFSIMKQARGAAKTTIKFKNLIRGTTIENTYRSGEKFETAMVEKRGAQFTYPDEVGNYFFMDNETFEEIMVEASVLEGKEKWIAEGMELTLVSFKDKIIEVVIPSPMVFTVAQTDPNVKGNSAQGVTKPATLDCGATIMVPGFIEQGQRIRVETEKGEYMERINK